MTVGSLIGRSSCVGAQRSGLAVSAAQAPDERPVPAPPAEPPALHGEGPEGTPGMEPAPEALRFAVALPAPVVNRLAGSRVLARLWSCAAALGPMRLGEVHRGAVVVVEPSAGSAVSGAFWVNGVAVVAAAPALAATGARPTHSPLPAGAFTAATDAVPEGARPVIGASGAAIGAMT
ncbi:MAG: hypothetical protein V7607_1998 [Solirubrobacteraceae bacterium]